jgi:hypothetical protein
MQAAPTVWVEGSLVRVRPSDAVGSATQITLYAAKGEVESFQIIVHAPSTGSLTSVDVTAPDLGGPTSTLYREQYHYLSSGSADWATNRNSPEAPGYIPDALVPFLNPSTGARLTGGTITSAPFTVAAGKNQPVWVDVTVPRATAAGVYTGTYTVTSTQGNATVSLTLRVWNFTLPLQPALKSCFEYWPTSDSGEGRGVLTADQELLRHRLNPISTATRNERSLIDNYGLQSTSLSFWSNASQSSGTMNAAPSVASVLADKAAHQSDLYMYCYSADEISNPALYSGIKAWARAFHSAGVDQLITMVPVSDLFDDGSGTGRSAVDDWVLLPKQYDQSLSDVLAALAKGDEIWSYNCNQQDDYSPKWQIDYAPLNYRLQPGFISQSLNLTGLLYWRVDNWSTDVWNAKYSSSGYPGEGLLVYPGAVVGLSGQVVPSMRLKYLRDGVDDYDYVALLKAQGQGSYALSVAASVGPDWSDWTRSPSAVAAARIELGNRLDSLAAPDVVTVTATANPTTIGSGGSAALHARATSVQGEAIVSWAWEDGGAGGTFLPGATSQSPVYVAPPNATGSDRLLTLTVTASTAAVSGTQTVTLTETSDTPTVEVVTVSASASASSVPSAGSVTLTAGAADNLGAAITGWAWDDGGAGGRFTASASLQNPTYAAPVNVSGADLVVTLTVTATAGTVSGSSSLELTVADASDPTASLFTDVPTGYWAHDAILDCVAAGIVSGYSNATYRPTAVVSRDQMATFISRALYGGDSYVPTGPVSPTFTDVPTDYWAYRYIETTAAANVCEGYSDGTYRPAEVVTRGQMAVFMARATADPTGDLGLAGYTPPQTPTFSDVGRPFWAYRYVEYVVSVGIATGYSDGTYRPWATCTRDQMAVYMQRGFNLGE